MLKGFEPGRGLYIYGCLQPFARSHFLRCPAGAVWKWVDEIAAPAGDCSAGGYPAGLWYRARQRRGQTRQRQPMASRQRLDTIGCVSGLNTLLLREVGILYTLHLKLLLVSWGRQAMGCSIFQNLSTMLCACGPCRAEGIGFIESITTACGPRLTAGDRGACGWPRPT